MNFLTLGNRSRSQVARAFALLATLAIFVCPFRASAQAFQLDQFRAAELPSDGFALSRPTDLGHLQLAAQLTFDYARNPLVYEARLGDSSSEAGRVINNQLVANVGVALGLFHRFVFFLNLPVNLLMMGDTVTGWPKADGTTIGDPVLGGRVRIIDFEHFSLGAQLAFQSPLSHLAGKSETYSGDHTPVFVPKILGEFHIGLVRIPLQIGFRVRGPSTLFNLHVGQEIVLGAGVIYPVIEHTLDALFEIYGTTSFEPGKFFSRDSSPLEAILGVKWHPTSLWHVGLAAGPGLSRGYGSPDIRVVLSAGWQAPPPEEVAHAEDNLDRDGDDIRNSADECPDTAEDVDGFQDQDGCPEPDNDHDNIPDQQDRCPNEAENRNDVDDEDGCPEPQEAPATAPVTQPETVDNAL